MRASVAARARGAEKIPLKLRELKIIERERVRGVGIKERRWE